MIVLAALCAGVAAAIAPADVAKELELTPIKGTNPLCEALKTRYGAANIGAYQMDLPLFMAKDFGFIRVSVEALVHNGFFADYGSQKWSGPDSSNFATYTADNGKSGAASSAVWFYLDGAERYTTNVCVRVITGQ